MQQGRPSMASKNKIKENGVTTGPDEVGGGTARRKQLTPSGGQKGARGRVGWCFTTGDCHRCPASFFQHSSVLSQAYCVQEQ